MKKTSRKVIAVIIAILMIISSLPIYALAYSDYAVVGQGTSGDTVVFPTNSTLSAQYCEYTFSGSTAGTGTFVNNSTGTNIYFTIDKNSTAGCPGSTTSETLSVGANSSFVKKNTFYIKNSTSSRYACFWDDNGTKKYRFDRQGSLSTYSQGYFALFTPDEGNTTSGINGYKRVTSVSEITNGKKFLIAHASAYNDDGSLASGGSWFVAYPATSSNPYQHVAKVFNKTEEEDTKNVTVTGYGTIAFSASSGRTSSTALTIVNDGEDGNFDIGFINIDISRIDPELYQAASTEYNTTINLVSGRENTGISFYYATQNTSAMKGTGANVGGAADVYGKGTGTHLSQAETYYGLSKLADVSLSTGDNSVSVDIADAINYALDNGLTTVNLVIANTKAGETGSTGGWTDTVVNVTNLEFAANICEKGTTDTPIQTFNLVEYDPVIYTMGTDYCSEGSNIADGSETNEQITNYTVKDGYKIKSIISSNSSDSIRASSASGDGHLTGNVYGATASTSKFITITTRLSGPDSKTYIQKDRLYVVTNPIPAHAAGGAYSYKVATGSYYSDYVGFNLVAENSYPTYGGGSSNSDQTKGNVPKAGLTTAIYSTSTFGDNYDKSQSFTTTSVKAAGCWGFYKCNATDAIVRVNSPNANYYFDKSLSSNYGISKATDGTYYISISYLPQYVFDAGRNLAISTYVASTEEDENFNTNQTFTQQRYHNTGSKHTFDITMKNTDIGAHSGTFAIREEAISIPGAKLTLYVPFTVTVFDKSTIRNLYNSKISEGLNSETFTTDSWDNYYNKILDVQEYLNQYNYSDSSQEETLIANLEDAYDNLMCNVTLNYEDGTVENTTRPYNSTIETPAEYEQSTEDSSMHIKKSYTWSPSIVTGAITSTQSSTTTTEAHTWDDGVITVESTCIENGEKLFTCTGCGATKKEVIAKTGHTAGAMKDENVVPATCTTEGSYDKVSRCTVCGEIVFSNHRTIAKTSHTYVYTNNNDGTHSSVCSVCGYTTGESEEHTLSDGVCTKCNAVVLDLTAYNNAIKEYQEIISNDEYALEYTEDSRKSYESTVKPQLNQTFGFQSSVDNATTKIISAKSKLIKNKFALLFNTLDESGTSITSKNLSYDYGSQVTLSPNGTARKWIETTNDGDSILSNDSSYSFIIKRDFNIYAVLQDSVYPANTSKVVFKGKGGTIIDVKYLAYGTSLDTTTVDIPDVPFYTSNGWSIDTVVGNGSEIAVTAQYKAN